MHITSGVSAPVCVLYLGKRLGYSKESMPPHSVVISFIGACLLRMGWFGFNAGSALAAGGLATSALSLRISELRPPSLGGAVRNGW